MPDLIDMKNKTVVVEAMDFVGVVKPSIVELESKGFFGGELKWLDNSWALVRSVEGVLIDSPESESLMMGDKDKALWFFPFSGQQVTYRIRITQDFINKGFVRLKGMITEVSPCTRKVNWES